MTDKPDRLRSVEEVAETMRAAIHGGAMGYNVSLFGYLSQQLRQERRAAMRRGMEIAREACLEIVAPEKRVYTAQIAGIIAARERDIRDLDLESLLEAE